MLKKKTTNPFSSEREVSVTRGEEFIRYKGVRSSVWFGGSITAKTQGNSSFQVKERFQWQWQEGSERRFIRYNYKGDQTRTWRRVYLEYAHYTCKSSSSQCNDAPFLSTGFPDISFIYLPFLRLWEVIGCLIRAQLHAKNVKNQTYCLHSGNRMPFKLGLKSLSWESKATGQRIIKQIHTFTSNLLFWVTTVLVWVAPALSS